MHRASSRNQDAFVGVIAEVEYPPLMAYVKELGAAGN